MQIRLLVPALAIAALALPAPSPALSLKDPCRELDVPCNRFAFRLFERLRSKDPMGNLFLSPWNVSAALAMTLNGADGPTRDAMLRTLEMEGLSLEEMNRGFAGYLESLRAPGKGVSLSMAQALWSRKGLALDPAFTERCRKGYGAEASELDFSDPAAPDILDAWVSKQTRGKIPEIAPRPMPEDLAMVLASAIHFQGDWTVPFEKDLTKQAFFLGAGLRNKPTGVWMMERTDTFAYVQGDGFQAAALPYGDGRFEMVLLLPDERRTLDSLGDALSMKGWTDWRPRMTLRKGTVQLPRFSCTWGSSLKEALEDLGMGVAFGPGADFSKARAEKDLWIGEIRHKAFLSVDETGTEAAAVTSVEKCFGCVEPPEAEKPFLLRCDRPFFFAIRDTRTGIPLFLGVLNNPS